jgi:hypothetical protein
MAKDIFWITTVFTIVFVVLLRLLWPADNHVVVKYDCSIAEISPDYPVAVKEACRKRSLK